jgi:FtsP/CotA-like multicopper oxidase with cupredoxin domain
MSRALAFLAATGSFVVLTLIYVQMRPGPLIEPVATSPAAIPVGATVSASSAPNPKAPAYLLHDATAPHVPPGSVHDIDLPILEKDITVAAGFVIHAWTFGGQVPGPVIRVHLGDTVRVHLTNRGRDEPLHRFSRQPDGDERSDG